MRDAPCGNMSAATTGRSSIARGSENDRLLRSSIWKPAEMLAGFVHLVGERASGCGHQNPERQEQHRLEQPSNHPACCSARRLPAAAGAVVLPPGLVACSLSALLLIIGQDVLADVSSKRFCAGIGLWLCSNALICYPASCPVCSVPGDHPPAHLLPQPAYRALPDARGLWGEHLQQAKQRTLRAPCVGCCPLAPVTGCR